MDFNSRLYRVRAILTHLDDEHRAMVDAALADPIDLDALSAVGPVLEGLVSLARAENIAPAEVASAVRATMDA